MAEKPPGPPKLRLHVTYVDKEADLESSLPKETPPPGHVYVAYWRGGRALSENSYDAPAQYYAPPYGMSRFCRCFCGLCPAAYQKLAWTCRVADMGDCPLEMDGNTILHLASAAGAYGSKADFRCIYNLLVHFTRPSACKSTRA